MFNLANRNGHLKVKRERERERERGGGGVGVGMVRVDQVGVNARGIMKLTEQCKE